MAPRPLAGPGLKRRHPELDFSYLETSDWEGSSIHRHSRTFGGDEPRLQNLTRNGFVSEQLFLGGLRLLADSMIAHWDAEEREGSLRYYPPAVLTFWSGLETYVRDASVRMTATVKDVPKEIEQVLLEEESFVDKAGQVKDRQKHRAILYRYAILLQYGYQFRADRGCRYWQRLVAAQNLRNYYSHPDVHNPRAVSEKDVLASMENVLMAIIWPSAELKRTLFLRAYDLYEIWAWLDDHARGYTEKPSMMDWNVDKLFMFHCNFKNVDKQRFPNLEELRQQTIEDPESCDARKRQRPRASGDG